MSGQALRLERLQQFLAALPDYVILRNHDVVAHLETGGDVDVLVGDLELSQRLLLRHFGCPVWLAKRSYGTSYFYPWGHIDLVTRLEWRGAVFLANTDVFAQSTLSPFGLRQPRLAHEALVSWLTSVLWGRFFKERYRATILRAAREDGAALSRALCDAVGNPWGERLMNAVLRGEPELAATHVWALRRHVFAMAMKRDAWHSVFRHAMFWYCEIKLRFTPLVPWIAILGPDGSGKSTLIDGLASRLHGTFSRVERGHWRPGILWSRNVPPDVIAAPQQQVPRTRAASVAKLGLFLLDWWLWYYFHWFPARAKGRIFVFDRCFIDILVDPMRYRYGGLAAWSTWFARVLPQPDRTFILDVAPEKILVRKRELSAEDLLRLRQSYRELPNLFGNVVIIDASVNAESVADDVAARILAFSTQRTALRLGDVHGAVDAS